MKKLVLVLAMALIAAPSFALTLGLVDNGNDTVSLTYSGASTANLPRAFALTVTIDGGAQITAVTPAITGVSTQANPGYGIFPGTIDINSSGIVQTYGSPLALQSDPGALDQELPSSGFVIELGSLYAPRTSGIDVNEPATSGTLATFDVNCNGASGNVNIAVAEENTYRGGVVLEDGTVPSPDLTASLVYTGCVPSCSQPVAATTPTPANSAVGVSMFPTKPTLSWTPAAGDVNPRYDVYFGTVNPPVSVVSANQTGLSYLATGAVQGVTYYWKVVSKNDCNPTGVSSAVWTFNTDCLKSTDTGYATWVALGKPSCFCYKRHCRGDGNGSATLSKWITAADFTNFQAGYNKTVTQLKGKVDINGVPAVCADYNHAMTLSKPVTAADFTIFQTYYNKATTMVPVCPNTNINFWTNN